MFLGVKQPKTFHYPSNDVILENDRSTKQTKNNSIYINEQWPKLEKFKQPNQ